jgi:hypothetical protein
MMQDIDTDEVHTEMRRLREDKNRMENKFFFISKTHPAICNESACTCFTNNSIIDWKVGFYEKQIKHFIAVQYMSDLKIRDNALFDSHNMFLVEIVQELSTKVFRESNEDLKLEYPWSASQELGKEINKKK